MTNQQAAFVTLDVFTTKRFKGNQLAVVEVTNSELSHQDMQIIANEFNFSETVFLNRLNPSRPPRIRIFTPVNEMEFAGHPVIGAGHVFFRQLLPKPVAPKDPENGTLLMETNAGTVTVRYDEHDQIISVEVPHNVHIHSNMTPRANILDTQPAFAASATETSMKDKYPAVSIVRGVTYVLVDFTEQPDLFAKVTAGPSPVVPLDNEWEPSFSGTMYYRASEVQIDQGKKVQHLRVRMVAINVEDPACGSGCCALGAYLALQDGVGNGEYRFHFDQGYEIGRDSSLTVDIVLNEHGDKVSTMLLSGQAVLVTEGTLFLPK